MATTVLTPVVDVLPEPEKDSPLSRIWAWSWPKLLAIGLVLGAWQIVVWSGWRPEYVLPGPIPTLQAVWEMMGTDRFWSAIATTLTRAVAGFALALLIGTTIGVLVARVRPLRLAVGALITGLQTMPSIAWFPLAILLFKIGESAILFVVVLGAAPSIANGIIAGVDGVLPVLRRVGHTLGARGPALYRDVIVPAAMPTVLSGLKQGWAFSWRSLMAGELLVIVPGTQSLGTRLQFARDFSDSDGLIATLLVILLIGILVDGLVFGQVERVVLARRGLRSEHARDLGRRSRRRERSLVSAAAAV